MRLDQPIFGLFAQMRSWLRAMWRRNRLESDMEAELQLHVGSSRVDLQACKLEYSIVSPK